MVTYAKNREQYEFSDHVPELESYVIDALRVARDAVYDSRTGRARGMGTAIPVFAPTLDAIADYRDGDYTGAVLNAALAAGDVLPWASAGKILNLGSRVGWRNLVHADLTFNRSKGLLRKGGYIKPGQEVHHTVAIGGKHHTENWRNSLLLLKPMRKEDHKLLSGKWKGVPKYPLPVRFWFGTNHWQKNIPAGAATYGADYLENRER